MGRLSRTLDAGAEATPLLEEARSTLRIDPQLGFFDRSRMPCSHGASWEQPADLVEFVREMCINSIDNLKVFVAAHTRFGSCLLVLDPLAPGLPSW